MKIAQVAPLYESVPPKLYGGTERIVSYLTEELVNRGHDVTLFATGDSITRAKLVTVAAEGLRMNENCVDPIAHHIIMLQEIAERASEFDLLHFHIDYLHFPLSHLYGYKHLTTLHGRLDIPDLVLLYRKFNKLPLVSISDSQRKPISFARFIATVYHGLPLDLFQKGEGKGNYFAFLGRISPEKGVDRAIEIAKAAGIKLRIAAKIDKPDQAYFDKHIAHLFDDPLVEYVGEISEKEKGEFLGNAMAMLFPIDWPEPFGLVQIEAMACGTPVIAFPQGSVPEIIENGLNGFIVSSVEEAVDAVNRLHTIDRQACRMRFEECFSASVMAENYERIYESIVKKNRMFQTATCK
jgi:glycosyltransferase involved in cell wall biosynthesis